MWTIFGAGGLVWDIIDAIESMTTPLGINERVKQIVLNQPSTINFDPYKVITLKEYLEKPEAEDRIFGFIDPRKEKFLKEIRKIDKDFRNVIHARAWVCRTTKLGNGNYLAANSTIASKVLMGNFNYLNRNASIGHHTYVGSCNHIGPGATICGKCSIGNYNFLGAGCTVRDGVAIKENIIVGANALVTNDLTESGVYVGAPAKKIDAKPRGSAANFL